MKRILFFLALACLAANGFAWWDPQPPEPSEPDGEIGGHEYVDLGLPSGTFWATCNIGTTSPYETGPYFAWGEVEPRDYFTWENYEFYIDYVSDEGWFVLEDIGSDICGTEYDAARHAWGGGWRMPNEEERYELRMLCWNKWVEENGVNGVRIYGRNEHNIFLPACGHGKWYNEPQQIGWDGGYWTGVEAPETNNWGVPIEPSNLAKALLSHYGGLEGGETNKATGKNIRAVINPREAGIAVVETESPVRIVCQQGLLKVKGIHAECALDLYDLSGRIVFSALVDDGVGCRLPVLSDGVYVVVLSDGKTTIKTQSIIKK